MEREKKRAPSRRSSEALRKAFRKREGFFCERPWMPYMYISALTTMK
jgi:hypothetical protein